MSSRGLLPANSSQLFIALSLMAVTACGPEREAGRSAQNVRAPSLSYTSSGGCGSVFLFGGSEDQMEWLQVFADRRTLGISTTAKSYDLAADTMSLRVWVELFERPGDPDYCNDAPLERLYPTATWIARSGRVTVYLIDSRPGFSYTACVQLDSCVFKNGDGLTKKQTAPIYLEARVGWKAD